MQSYNGYHRNVVKQGEKRGFYRSFALFLVLVLQGGFIVPTDWASLYRTETTSKSVIFAFVESIDPTTGARTTHQWSTHQYDAPKSSHTGTFTFDAATKTITSSAWGGDSLARGQSVVITGSASNNATVTIATITGDVVTVYEDLTDEVDAASVTAVGQAFAFLPYLDDPGGYSSTLASGDRLGGPSSRDEGGIKVLSPDTEGYPGDALYSLEFSGRPALLQSLVYDPARGTEAGFDERITLADVRVGPEPVWEPNELRLPLIPPSDGLSGNVGNVYSGQDLALLFNGDQVDPDSSTRVVVDGTEWSPSGAFSIQIYAYVSTLPSGGVESIWNKRLHKIQFEDFPGEADWPTRASFEVTVGGVAYKAWSTNLKRGRFHWLNCSFDPATGKVEIFADRELPLSTATSTLANADTSTDDLIFGMNQDLTGEVYRGIAASFRLWDALLSRADLVAFQSGPLQGNETDLVAVWKGDTNLAVDTLFDYGPSRSVQNNSSVLDGTVAFGTIAHTLEGGTALQGNPKPFVMGFADNAPGDPVAPQFQIYQFSEGGCERAHRILDSGGEITLEAVYLDLVDFFQNPASVAGKYTWFPFQCLAMVNTTPVGEITAQMWGEGPWTAGLDFDGVDDFVDFGTTPSTVTNADFTFEAEIHLLDPEGPTQFIAGDSSPSNGGFALFYSYNGGGSPILRVIVATASSTIVGEVPVGKYIGTDPGDSSLKIATPFHFAATVERGASSTQLLVYINGVERLDQTSAFGAPPGVNTFYIGAGPAVSTPGRFRISEPRLWSDVRSEAEIREWMSTPLPRDTTLQPAGLRSFWPAPLVFNSNTNWEDEAGGVDIDGAITGATWDGGVTAECTIVQLMQAMVCIGGVDKATIDLSRAWDIPDAPVALISSGDKKVIEVIDEIRESANVFVVFNRTSGLWEIFRLDDPLSGTATKTIESWEIDGVPGGNRVERPPAEFLVGHSYIGMVQDESNLIPESGGGPDGARRAMLAESLRYAKTTVEKNDDYYLLAAERSVIEGRFVFPEDAKTEADRQAALRTQRNFWTVPLSRGQVDVSPGTIVLLETSRLPGADRNWLTVRVDDDFHKAALKVWG